MASKDESLSDIIALISRSTCYAGIGSRAAPPSILPLIRNLAAILGHHGLILRSGGAQGADTAFEQGSDRAQGKKEIFLPWKEFNGNPSPFFDPPEQAECIAALCHPNWRACTPAARKLHARNCQQVYGAALKCPVDFILFWAPEKNGIVQGGTATAVSLAQEMMIPTFNLWSERVQITWARLLDGG